MHSSALRTVVLAITVVLLALAGEWFLWAAYEEDEVSCQQTSLPASLPELPDASGVAASQRTPGLLWAVNDSAPVLFGIDDAGEVTAHLTVEGAPITDWEDVSVGRCARGSCLYIADIGDNKERRASVRLYRIPEPGPHEKATAAAEIFEAQYPDRPHDAEGLFVTPDGTAYLLTKESRTGALYRFPPLEPGKMLTLERLAVLPVPNITDADASPDGDWVLVRNADELVFYRTSALLDGDVEHGAVVKVSDAGESKGKGVTFSGRGDVFLAGGGSSKRQPGTLVALRCTLPDKAR
jgi:hypothetical protein